MKPERPLWKSGCVLFSATKETATEASMTIQPVTLKPSGVSR
jgi:hypothetical protein